LSLRREILKSVGLEGVKSKGLEGVKVLDTLGKEVILLVQDARELPFDFKKFKHIIYEKNEGGMERLKAELEAYLDL